VLAASSWMWSFEEVRKSLDGVFCGRGYVDLKVAGVDELVVGFVVDWDCLLEKVEIEDYRRFGRRWTGSSYGERID